jgi:nucleotide-binding universal stress UspA family protein
MAAVVVGYDESPGSQQALEKAIELARGLSAKLVVVYGYGAPGSALSGEEVGAHRDALAEQGRTLVAAAEEKARAAGIEAETDLIDARAVEALLSAAEKHAAGYIVVGGYGESPIRGAILGSTPHKLLHLSTTPVVVVPAS